MSRTTFTKEEDAYLRARYLDQPIKMMAKVLGRSYCGIKGRMDKIGVEVPKHILAARKKANQFKPGQESFNKGLKQSDYMSTEAIEKTRKTQFNKGNIPHNTREDGDLSIRTDKTGREYVYIRVAVAEWEPLHKVKWEAVNGPVPKGHCLWSIDGDSTNTDPENWELITRKENYKRNSGSVNLTDPYVARTIAGRDSELKEEILKHPELIEIKRLNLQLNRKIKNHGQK